MATTELATAEHAPAGAAAPACGAQWFEAFVLKTWIAYYRAERGEFLYSQQCLAEAVDLLLRLLRRYAAEDGFGCINYTVPRRGLDTCARPLARELLSILMGTVPAPERQLLELAERHLRPRAPELPWVEHVSILRRMPVH